MVKNMKVCILGCGAYGSSLSIILEENGNDVSLWTAFEKEALTLNETRISPKLPNSILPKNIKITSSLEEATKDAEFILLAIPTAYAKETLLKAKEYIKDKPIVIASKGIEKGKYPFISDMIKNEIGTNNVAVISGPSFAVDVAEKVPVGLSIACENDNTIDIVKKALSNSHFKLRANHDVIGTEICGAIKNVFAIAAGMLIGMNLPESTTAMFITESLNDIKNLIINLGGNGQTSLSFAGVGDLILTATSSKSRNFSFGYLIGSGASKEEIQKYKEETTIEGLYTLNTVNELIKSKNIEMPIINLLNEIICQDKNPQELVNFLINKD